MKDNLFLIAFLFVCIDLFILDISIIVIYKMINDSNLEIKKINKIIKKNNFDDTTPDKMKIHTSKLSFGDLKIHLKRKNTLSEDSNNYMSNYDNEDLKKSLERIQKEESIKK